MKINPLALVPIRIDRSTLTVSVDVDDNSILERIGNLIVSRLQIEYESKNQKIRGQDGTLALAKLNEQTIAYSKGARPFDRLLGDDTNILKDLIDFLDRDNTDILVFVAVKTFSIKVNSMADERDQSKEDSDAWLDNSTIDFSDLEDESGYERCSTPVFLGGKDAHLDVPELLDLFSDRSIMIGAQNQ
ncbi:hypothetical protein K503DRAFT_807001 [Rhizopogon vinicolor AM-OR11-026]|uniref:Uncharacterized protein n=1 Tax=Rhizopogon vinicolor AM-OR11-026 TaxID=1314800 RepID=A0A1B7MDC9_9AGAM|nr:hypothetical protein K503DRAFT_807001 [Rhizopogon vinicolor AM-OR11-026]